MCSFRVFRKNRNIHVGTELPRNQFGWWLLYYATVLTLPCNSEKMQITPDLTWEPNTYCGTRLVSQSGLNTYILRRSSLHTEIHAEIRESEDHEKWGSRRASYLVKNISASKRILTGPMIWQSTTLSIRPCMHFAALSILMLMSYFNIWTSRNNNTGLTDLDLHRSEPLKRANSFLKEKPASWKR